MVDSIVNGFLIITISKNQLSFAVMRRMLLLCLVLLQSLSINAQQKELPYVVLISFDGFRSDYVDRLNLPNFRAFIKSGSSSEALIPSFPSKTFPNHYTLVTGLYPGHHGLVDNYFFDPSRQETYSMRDRKMVTDSSYYGGTPLWQLARKQGVKSASYFWVGSELEEESLRPDYYYQYDQSVAFNSRVDQVISWLQLPKKERPHLITLYFSSPDTESHTFGPFANETKEKLLGIDSLLGNFMTRIKELKLPITVILVSDHGMLEIKKEIGNYIFLDELVKTGNGITVSNGGTQTHIYASTQKKSDSIFSELQRRKKNFSIVKRKDFQPAWNYDHKRAGDLLLIADPGKFITTTDRNEILDEIKQGGSFGVHGYDPALVKDMYGIFYAAGPNIKQGVRIKAFSNIHVYPLVAKILGLTIPPIDGSFETLKPIYKE
jgi:predicted AlkP superfamily pyrophosphatase or phosphodiesterase